MTTEPPATAKRVVSLDAFRAVTVALMIFMDHPTVPSAVPWWLMHPDWHGFRLADAVFPAFLFIAGVSMAYSSRKTPRSQSSAAAGLTFVRRIALLFGLGLGLNFIKYGAPLRIMGVLQRIGLASLVAYPFRRSAPRTIVAVALALIAAHSGILLFVGAPGVPAGSLASQDVNISGAIDTAVLTAPHTYKGQGFDPEGLLGTLTASATLLLGLALGRTLVAGEHSGTALRRAFSVGLAGIASGLLLGLAVPLNKKLWTGSFTLVSAGIFTVVFLLLYLLTDHRGRTRILTPFVPLGRNALVIYIGSNALIAALRHFTVTNASGASIPMLGALADAASRAVGPTAATLGISTLEVVLWAGVAAWLHRKRIYVKL